MVNDLFSDDKVNLDVLKKRAVGMRWAGVPEGTIPLTSADPDFPPAQEINEAMIEFIRGGYFPYIPDAIDGLREIISQRMLERKNEIVPPEFIMPVDSAANAMHAIASSVLSPGDEAIIFDPVDLLFGMSVRYAGATAVYYSPKYENGAWDFSGLNKLITPRTKMLCLCNPHNPLGLLYTEDELGLIADLAEKHNLWIMNDEVWSDIIYSEKPFVSINSLGAGRNRKTISCYGLSKGFALPGLRVGYIYALNKNAFEAVSGRANGLITGVDYVNQIAMKTAFEKCYYWVDAFTQHLQNNRDYLFDRLNKMPLIKAYKQEATFVSFTNISATNMSAQQFADFMLKKQKVALVPGTVKWFGPGAEGHIRICFSTSHAILKEALDRFEEGIREIAGK